MPEAKGAPEIHAPPDAFVYPLNEFYAARKLPLPAISRVEAEGVPEPYRALLVHNGDMTSRLETFHQGTIRLKLLGRRNVSPLYFREVVLFLEGSGKPVEFGAIKIHLDLFPPEAWRVVLEEHLPLGRILNDFRITFASRPQAFLRVSSDRFISGVLELHGTHTLYGRCNKIVNSQEQALAEIVEILPP